MFGLKRHQRSTTVESNEAVVAELRALRRDVRELHAYLRRQETARHTNDGSLQPLHGLDGLSLSGML